MPLLQLDMLPMEVLQAISQFLDASHKPSVASVSLVNRTCRRAAAPALFRELHVRKSSPQQLVDDTERWYQILLANDSLRYVRKVVILSNTYRHLRLRTHGTATDAITGKFEAFVNEKPWLPLATLIEKFTGLRDVHFSCNTTIASCLLDSLRRANLSTCRLHVTDFRLRGLQRPLSIELPQPLSLLPEDVALIDSANLCAISLNTNRSGSVNSDYTVDALFELVARAYPALREVEVVRTRPKVSPRARSKKPYPGLRLDYNVHPSIRPPGSKAQLTSLILRGRDPQIQRWQHYANFTVLRKLNITDCLDADTMDWVADSAPFPALSCLEIRILSRYALSTAKLLSSLPGLQDLTIHGVVNDSIMMAIEQKHGLTLQRLSLRAFICSADTLTSLRDACPQLAHLTVTVPRTRGDDDEVAIYTTLGTFPQLQTISLELDCAIANGDETITNANKNSKYIQSTLINCAVDSQLAASIFDKISSAKLAGSAPLHTVELNVVNAGIVGSATSGYDANKAHVYHHFARKWICNVHPRDDWRGGAVALESEASRLGRERHDNAGFQLPELGELEGAFRELWPDMGGDWRDEWRSFALQ